MPPSPRNIERWNEALLRQAPPRGKSLIVTLFGDAIAPTSNALWLGDLIQLLGAFHLTERLVRTSVFRLMEEGWLVSERDGRRSRYSLTAHAADELRLAQRHIYRRDSTRWDGEWTLVLLGGQAGPARRELRSALTWLGLGESKPTLLLHPLPDREALAACLQRMEAGAEATVLRARDLGLARGRTLAELAADCWNLDEVAARYREFIARFKPLCAWQAQDAPVDPRSALTTRTLLIHEYRRATLHDPRLPAEMLPRDWPGHAAQALCASLYRWLYPYSAAHLQAVLGRKPPSLATLGRFAMAVNEEAE